MSLDTVVPYLSLYNSVSVATGSEVATVGQITENGIYRVRIYGVGNMTTGDAVGSVGQAHRIRVQRYEATVTRTILERRVSTETGHIAQAFIEFSEELEIVVSNTHVAPMSVVWFGATSQSYRLTITVERVG